MDILPIRQKPVQKKIHIWKKADTELIKEDLAAFVEETQTRYKPVETLWAIFTAKCQSVLARMGQSEEVLVFHQKQEKRQQRSSPTQEEWHCP